MKAFRFQWLLSFFRWLSRIRRAELRVVLDEIALIWLINILNANLLYLNYYSPNKSRNSAAVAIERVSRDLLPPGDTSATFTNLE